MFGWIKKHKMVVLVVGLIAALAVVGVTAGWFTASASVNNNYVKTGNLDATAWGGPLTVDNLEPGAGYESAGVFCVKNDGDYDMKWRAWLKDVNDPKGLRHYLRVKAILRPNDQGNYGPSEGLEVFSGVKFTDLMSPNSYVVLADPDEDGDPIPFEPGHIACYDVQVACVGPGTPDSVQNATVTANLYIQATQWINPGWGN